MANDILTEVVAKANFTITLASLAASSGRQSTMVDNSASKHPAAIVYVKVKTSGSAPSAGRVYSVYLLRGDDPSSSTYRTDGAGASDAAITINNAQLLGTIKVTTSASTSFYGEFDTSGFGPLGPEWGIAVVNDTDQTADSTGGSFLAEYVYYHPEVQ